MVRHQPTYEDICNGLKEILSEQQQEQTVTKPASDQERGNQQPETSQEPPRSQEPGASDANRFEEIDSEVKFKKCSNLEDSFLGGDQSTILDSSF